MKDGFVADKWSHVEKKLADSIVQFMEMQVEIERTQLISDNYPYNDSIIFLNKFMFFFSFVVHKTVTAKEFEFFSNFELRGSVASLTNGQNGEYGNYIFRRRNWIDGNKAQVNKEDIGIEEWRSFQFEDEPSAFFTTDKTRGKKSFLKMKETVATKRNRIISSLVENQVELGRQSEETLNEKFANLAEVILSSSYNPLDVYFFIKIRAVPMFMVGMFDLQYLTADNIRQLPITFFEHDLFHVDVGTAKQQYQLC